MEYITEWVGRLVVYLIFESVVVNLLQGKNYMKYVRLVMGIILIIFLAEPLLEVMAQAENYEFHLKRYLTSEESEDDSFIYEMHGIHEEMILRELEEQMKERITAIVLHSGLGVVSIDIDFNEGTNEYGVPEEIQLVLTSTECNTELFATDTPAVIRVRDRVAEEFYIKKEKILVEVRLKGVS